MKYCIMHRWFLMRPTLSYVGNAESIRIQFPAFFAEQSLHLAQGEEELVISSPVRSKTNNIVGLRNNLRFLKPYVWPSKNLNRQSYKELQDTAVNSVKR